MSELENGPEGLTENIWLRNLLADALQRLHGAGLFMRDMRYSRADDTLNFVKDTQASLAGPCAQVDGRRMAETGTGSVRSTTSAVRKDAPE